MAREKWSGVTGVDGALVDLGWSLSQEPRISFQTPDQPLDMRYDLRSTQTAAQVLQSFSQADLEHVLREFGEERHARLVATAIVSKREREPLERVGQLTDLLFTVSDKIRKKQRRSGKRSGNSESSGATAAWSMIRRVFQALRICVNRELDDLNKGLQSIFENLFVFLFVLFF